MSYETTAVEILISSPSDVDDARAAIEQVISDWNIAHSRSSRLTAVPVHWRTHAVPEAGADPQAILNKQIVTRCDVLVAAFGARLGTATPRALSGTVEEIEEFIKADKPVMLYVLTERHDSAVDAQQVQALDAYLADFKKRGLLSEVETIGDLRREFARHLPQRLAVFMRPQNAKPPVILDDVALKALVCLFRHDGQADLDAIQGALRVKRPTAEFHLHRLWEAELLHYWTGVGDTRIYALTQEGRSELFSRGLLT